MSEIFVMSALDTFFSSKITCTSCGKGPINFSMVWNNDKLVSKYGNYCSFGCIINYYIDSEERNNSRPVTPTKHQDIKN